MRWDEWYQQAVETDEQCRAAGRAARTRTPRGAHAVYEADPARDPLGIIEAQNADRIPELVPLRMQRMSQSAFAFYRGTAAIQAADLAHSPDSGHLVVACGDAHISNFGVFAAPDRSLVFDMNDFDEASVAPWEWDLKRLATSIVLASRENGFGRDDTHSGVLAALTSYRRSMRALAKWGPAERYYTRQVISDELTLQPSSAEALERAKKRSKKRTADRVAAKIMYRDDRGRWTIREDPPTLTHMTVETFEELTGAFQQYLDSAGPDIRLLLTQYRPVDAARRVVGVGSVGTRCYIAVLVGPDDRPIIMQLKEAGRSVLDEYGRMGERADLPERLSLHVLSGGRRVTAAQRMLQAASDPFLGYIDVGGRGYYARQFRDRNTSFELERLDAPALTDYVIACGRALARGHSQSPGPAFIAEYAGKGSRLDEAILQWAEAYADQAEADHAEFVRAIEGGRFVSSS